MKPLIIYHGNCADGFGAAWVLWKFFKGEADFYPGVYQRPPPKVEGRQVIFVDFSYKRKVMVEFARQNALTLVLDHHDTALTDLKTDLNERVYQAPDSRKVDWATFQDETYDSEQGDLYTVFDMERSGAGLTWDFFYPQQPRPALINHIEDRDLWRFKIPGTREIQANLFSYPYEFQLWDDLMTRPPESLILDGTAIERKHFKDIAELVQVVTRPMWFRAPWLDGPAPSFVTVPVANLPYTLTSDAGHLLCERSWYGTTQSEEAEYIENLPPGQSPRNPGPFRHKFAAVYWDKPDGRQFSLRSQDDGADVGAIAQLYGGGGHAHASGFLIPYDRLSEFEV